ncbi:hypothetical protein P8452_66682 [Trifolium repens]|nr:hypothetical protein P8452_66682 [Trifolium repens]
MSSSHCLSTAREIMNLHDQAVQDYSHIDNSNTLFILRDVGSGVLTLTWNGFCKIALPNENSEITMALPLELYMPNLMKDDFVFCIHQW